MAWWTLAKVDYMFDGANFGWAASPEHGRARECASLF